MTKDLTGKFKNKDKTAPTSDTIDFLLRQDGLLNSMAGLGSEALPGALAAAAAAAKNKNKGPKT
jgi:hypothetical protein